MPAYPIFELPLEYFIDRRPPPRMALPKSASEIIELAYSSVPVQRDPVYKQLAKQYGRPDLAGEFEEPSDREARRFTVTESARIGGVFIPHSSPREIVYAHAATDTSEDATLSNQPLAPPPFKPVIREPFKEWIALWDAVYKESTSTKAFSTRIVTDKEQSKLKGDFANPDEWPVQGIVGQREAGGSTEYLVEWRKHPTTGEEFEPTWVFSSIMYKRS
jgi:hypothetical protein